MPLVRIVTEGATMEFENGDVETVRDLLEQTKDILNIPSSANIAVNGAPATAETPLADGDEVTTTKPAGRKGK